MAEQPVSRRSGITPGQVRRALKNYAHLTTFLEKWFPAGKSVATLTRTGSAGRPTERLVLARSDVQDVYNALTYAISRLTPQDRAVVQAKYIEQHDAYGTAAKLGVSRATVFNRLAVIDAEIAVRLSVMRPRIWRSFHRFIRVVL